MTRDPKSLKGAALFDLSGKRALVTGSSRGLGLAMARGLAEAGAHVVLNGRNGDTLHAAAAALREDGLAARAAAFDVCDEASVKAGVAEVLASGAIDVLVNNVGIHDRAPLAEMTADQWRCVIDANLTSAFLVSRHVAPSMIERRSGKVIHTCSLMSEACRPTTGNYAAAKGGLKMLTRAMATEWAKHNVQVNGIGPGYFATELTRPLVDDPEFNAWVCQRTPAGRWGDPKELVGAAVFLASAASDYVNGQIVYVDGGLLAAI
ncbi:MAG: SDR family oxidoreductase [Planctomycetota bacterium]